MRHAWVICLKDLRQRMRDRTALLVGVVMPIVLATLLGAALGGRGPYQMRLALVDLDASPLSQALEAFTRRPWLEPVVELQRLPTAEAGRAAIEAHEIDAALVIPDGFGAALEAGHGAALEVLVDAENGYAARLTRSLGAAFVAAAEVARGDPDALRPASLERLDSRRLRVSDFYVASMSVLFMTFTVLAGVRAFQAEQDAGTIQRLAATPATARAILVGKFAALVLLGLLQMGVMIGFSTLVLGTAWGRPLAVAALVLTSVLYAVGLTSFVVAAAGDAERGRVLATMLIFLLAVLGGQFLPPQGLPDIFDTFQRLTPNGQAFRGFTDLAGGGEDPALARIAEPLAVTGVVGVAGIAYGVRRARRALMGEE